MSIRNWPSNERPREKLLEHGAQALSEAELLAVLIQTGTRGQSALDIARTLLCEFGSLRELLTAGRDRVCAIRGLGTSRFVTLQAALELARRHYQQLMMTGCALNQPQAIREFLQMRLRDLAYEVFCCLYLDRRNRVIAFDELFRGTIDGATVHPREVVRAALTRNATAVVVAHNHPSGVAEPSRADEQITRVLKQALALVEVRLIDHLIIGDGICTSLADRGLV